MPKLKKLYIVDYKLSNLYSIYNALKKISYTPKIIDNKKDIQDADLIILPGTGSFAEAIKNIKEMELIADLKKHINFGKPFFGICLGFQLLFNSSNEIKKSQGLKIFKSDVKPLENNKIRKSNIGWNRIFPIKNRLFTQSDFFYFVHSYFVDVKKSEQNIISSYFKYKNKKICSSIIYNNIVATQFHPEKSGINGLKLIEQYIKNFK